MLSYLEGYGREFGTKMTYSIGVTYGLGLLLGGTYGAALGLKKGGATSKLRLNAIMNRSGQNGKSGVKDAGDKHAGDKHEQAKWESQEC